MVRDIWKELGFCIYLHTNKGCFYWEMWFRQSTASLCKTLPLGEPSMMLKKQCGSFPSLPPLAMPCRASWRGLTRRGKKQQQIKAKGVIFIQTHSAFSKALRGLFILFSSYSSLLPLSLGKSHLETHIQPLSLCGWYSDPPAPELGLSLAHLFLDIEAQSQCVFLIPVLCLPPFILSDRGQCHVTLVHNLGAILRPDLTCRLGQDSLVWHI